MIDITPRAVKKPRETLEDYKELCEIQKRGNRILADMVRKKEKEIKRLTAEVVRLNNLLRQKRY